MSFQSFLEREDNQRAEAVAEIDTVAPFDWGIGFAFAHITSLFLLALVPAVIKVGLRYLEFFEPLSLRQSFLIAAIDIGTKTWLLVSVMLLSIVVCQGGRYRLVSLGQKALLTMPKVLMSSVTLLMVVGAFILAPWMYLFVLFLMWAPFFCAAEICAKTYRTEEDADELELDEDYVRPDARIRARVIRYFADKPIWFLGFSRSIQFTANRRHFVVTVQLALLLLVALTVPLATVVAFAGFYQNFGWIVFESFFSYALHSVVLGVACATFLRLQPKEALEELDIVRDTLRSLPVRPVFRLHGKLFPFFLIALLGGLATKATVDYIVVNNSKPPNVQIALESMQRTEQQLIFHLKIEDNKNLFRWLNPQSFRLEIIPEKSEAAAQKAETPEPGKGEAPVAKKEKGKDEEKELIPPDRVIPFSLDGKALPEDNFVPSKDPLRLVLYYPVELPKGQTKGSYALYYLPLLGEPEPFLAGKFGAEDIGAKVLGAEDNGK